jgi:hypothetical protein
MCSFFCRIDSASPRSGANGHLLLNPAVMRAVHARFCRGSREYSAALLPSVKLTPIPHQVPDEFTTASHVRTTPLAASYAQYIRTAVCVHVRREPDTAHHICQDSRRSELSTDGR